LGKQNCEVAGHVERVLNVTGDLGEHQLPGTAGLAGCHADWGKAFERETDSSVS
jgi:hypothetical protein